MCNDHYIILNDYYHPNHINTNVTPSICVLVFFYLLIITSNELVCCMFFFLSAVRWHFGKTVKDIISWQWKQQLSRSVKEDGHAKADEASKGAGLHAAAPLSGSPHLVTLTWKLWNRTWDSRRAVCSIQLLKNTVPHSIICDRPRLCWLLGYLKKCFGSQILHMSCCQTKIL